MKKLRNENYNLPEHFNESYNKNKESKDTERFLLLISKFTGGKMIDIGCLNSTACQEAKEEFRDGEYWGLDFADEVIDDLKEKYKDIKYVQADFLNTGLEDNYFDYVVAGEAIEHSVDPERFLKEMFRILKVGGILALSTPLSEEENNGSLSYDHIWSFEKQDIKNLLKKYGKVETSIFTGENFPKIIAFCKYENSSS